MNIYDTKEIEQYTVQQLLQIDKALVACAFKIRDRARDILTSGKYKHMNVYKDAIMLGKLHGDSISIHGFGYNDPNKKLYKARFFILGTDYRRQTRYRGQQLQKPYTKGFISATDAIDKATLSCGSLLDKYISTALLQEIK